MTVRKGYKNLNLKVVFSRIINSLYFCSGKGNKPYISLPKGKGVKLSIAEERDKRLGRS